MFKFIIFILLVFIIIVSIKIKSNKKDINNYNDEDIFEYIQKNKLSENELRKKEKLKEFLRNKNKEEKLKTINEIKKLKETDYKKFENRYRKKEQPNLKIHSINKQKEPKIKKKFYYGENWKWKKGIDYEFYIKEFYENEKYKVVPNGYINGLKDEGIDLVAHKENRKETILIQCKNWKSKAELKDIIKFYNDCKDYEKKYKKYLNGRHIRKVFVISNEIENKEINKFIRHIDYEIEFLNIPFFE